MQPYRFARGGLDDLPDMYALIDARIRWMDETGIRQWNVTDYWGCYPPEHYEKAARAGCVYTLRDARGALAAAAVLWEEDPRWPGDNPPAYYVHHLASALGAKGAGEALLDCCYRLAQENGKAYLRLDCAQDSPALNAYYQRQGFESAGFCVDGLYSGILRQKKT